MWLVWGSTAQNGYRLLGGGILASAPRRLYETILLWTDRDCPGIRAEAEALGYHGGSAVSFLRLTVFPAVDAMPVVENIGSLQAGLNPASPIWIETLRQLLPIPAEDHMTLATIRMNKQKLTRRLNAVGKEAFVSHYFLFKDYASSRISKDRAIKTLVDEGRSNENGASMRLGNAKTIFSEQSNCEALNMVQIAQRVSEETRRSAKAISERDCGGKKNA